MAPGPERKLALTSIPRPLKNAVRRNAVDKGNVLNGTPSVMKVSFIAAPFLIFCVYKCVRTIQAARRRKNQPFFAIPLGKCYAVTIKMTACFAGLALLTAVQCRIPVLGSCRIDRESLLPGLAFLILVLCLDPIEWKFTPAENRKRIASFLPRTARERISWLFVSMTAGVGEEIVYRAVLFGIFFRITGEYWIAACASAVLFALAHYSQGWLAIASLFLTAVCLQWLVRISGGLYVAIGVHFLHNFINGIVCGALIKPEEAAAESCVPGGVQANAPDSITQG
jgi:membrane protease YdiL (CAAX protease family)